MLSLALLVTFLAVAGPGWNNSLAIPPSTPAAPPGGAPLPEIYELNAYLGDPIPDEAFDGTIEAEWFDATRFSLVIGSYSTVAYLKHDDQYLYLALEIATEQEFRGYSEGYVWFDNGDGKEFDAGDDIITVEGGQGVLFEADFYYVGKYDFQFDPAGGGVNNAWGIGAYDTEKLSYVFEFLKELDSGDPLDVSLAPGEEVELIFGFVGEASPAIEISSRKYKVKIITEAATRAAAGKIADRIDQILDKVKKNLAISKPPRPEVKLDSGTYYDPLKRQLHIEPNATIDVIKHEYGHFFVHTLYGDAAYKRIFEKAGEDHCPTSEYGARLDGISKNSAKAVLAPVGAFSEAVATWFAAIVNKNQTWTKDTTQQVDVEKNTIEYTWGTLTATATPKISGNKVQFNFTFSDGRSDVTGPWLDSHKVESTIQAALWDITDGKANSIRDGDSDGLSVPINTVLTVMAGVKGKEVSTLKELVAALSKVLTETQAKALDKILERHGLK